VLAVLRIPAFRRLWLTLGLSSLGDWLGLLATSLFARSLFEGSAAQGAAFGGVIVVRLLPALVLFPFAGVLADRFDRRLTMVVCDLLRFLLFASIPIAGFLLDNVQAVTWALIATFLIETVTMFWMPAKEAAVPNLVPGRVEAANQLSLITTYALTPVLAALLLAGLSRAMLALVGDDASRLVVSPVDVALFFNALTFLAAAVVVWTIPDIGRPEPGDRSRRPGLLGGLVDGWRFLRRSEMVRGLVLGIAGAFAAGGVVVGVAPLYAAGLGGGDASFAILFALLFVGLGLGMAAGPRVVRTLSRRRWFGMSIVLAGASVTALSLAPHLAVAVPLTVLVGVGAGMAFLAGTTLLGTEVEDDVRGRTFAFVQTAVRVVLLLSIATGSVLGGLGGVRRIGGPGFPHLDINASRILLFVAGLLAVGAGVLAFRRMDDRPGVPVLQDLYAAVSGRPLGLREDRSGDGLFIVFEGGEGAGKSTQAVKLAAGLRMEGRECVLTREPGATQVGARIRGILLDKSSRGLAPRAEALLYAADRAHHVATVIRPSLERGDIVISDRYVDSSLAYQGAGRSLATQEIAWLSDWATGGLVPDLVVLLDVDPSVGLGRVSERGEADRLELEAVTFHQRVRQGFLDLAAADTRRYLVLDAAGDADDLAARVWARVSDLLGTTAAGGTDGGDGRGDPDLADTGS
jgi:dTMP kinase